MKPLEKDELYQHLSGFLKSKGVELREGSYARTIQKSCALLADAINLGQKGFDRAKVEVDRKLDQMRQVIHEKTAPKSSARPGAAAPPRRAAENSLPGHKSQRDDKIRKPNPRRPKEGRNPKPETQA